MIFTLIFFDKYYNVKVKKKVKKENKNYNQRFFRFLR